MPANAARFEISTLPRPNFRLCEHSPETDHGHFPNLFMETIHRVMTVFSLESLLLNATEQREETRGLRMSRLRFS
jgi:hypothetical protein